MAARQERLQQTPFLIPQIAGIETGLHGGAPNGWNSPYPQPRPNPVPNLNPSLPSSNEIAHQPLIHTCQVEVVVAAFSGKLISAAGRDSMLPSGSRRGLS